MPTPILAAGRHESQRYPSELVRVEDPAARSRCASLGDFAANEVKLLDLLGGEPVDGVWVTAKLQDGLLSRPHVELLDDPRGPRLLVEDPALVGPAPGIVDDQDHLGPRHHYPGDALQVVHYPPAAVDLPLQFFAHDLAEVITLYQRVRLITGPLCLPHPPGQPVEIERLPTDRAQVHGSGTEPQAPQMQAVFPHARHVASIVLLPCPCATLTRSTRKLCT